MILVEIARVFGTNVLDDVELKLNDSIKDNLLLQMEDEKLVTSRQEEEIPI
jgi:hypothetical protein